MKSLWKRLLSLLLLPLLLLPLLLIMSLSIAPPVTAASSQKCTTNTTTHTLHDPDNTTAVVVQKTSRCTDPVDDTYQYMSTSTYLVKYGFWGNWLFTWGISEQWIVDLTYQYISSFQNPPTTFFSQCCYNPDGSSLFWVWSSSASASQTDSQNIQASGSATIMVNIFTCSPIDPGLCVPIPYYYDTVNCNFAAHLTHPSRGCSG